MYQIREYTYHQAVVNNLTIYPSENPRWKLEVYNATGVFICYCGNSRLKDYPTYLEEKGLYIACRKRYQWFRRHGNPIFFDYGTPEWATATLLW